MLYIHTLRRQQQRIKKPLPQTIYFTLCLFLSLPRYLTHSLYFDHIRTIKTRNRIDKHFLFTHTVVDGQMDIRIPHNIYLNFWLDVHSLECYGITHFVVLNTIHAIHAIQFNIYVMWM